MAGHPSPRGAVRALLTGAMVLSMVAVAMVAQVDPAAVTVAVAMGPHPGGRAMALVAMVVRVRVRPLSGSG